MKSISPVSLLIPLTITALLLILVDLSLLKLASRCPNDDSPADADVSPYDTACDCTLKTYSFRSLWPRPF